MSDLLFEYKVRAKHRLGFKEFSFYATTDIEEFLNRNRIDYVRNATDTVENRLFKENKRLNNIINELESYLEKTIIDGGTIGSMTFWYRQVYDYLQKLKHKKIYGSVDSEIVYFDELGSDK